MIEFSTVFPVTVINRTRDGLSGSRGQSDRHSKARAVVKFPIRIYVILYLLSGIKGESYTV